MVANQRMLIRAGLLAVVAAVTVSSSGCSVEMVPATTSAAGSQTPGAQNSTQPSEPRDGGTTKAPTVQVTAIDPDESEETTLARRSHYAGEIEISTGCPDGVLTLSRTDTVTRLTENCHKVVVDAPYVTLLAEKVDVLIVNGAASSGHFIIRELGSATLDAPYSYLYWDRGTPRLSVSGYESFANPNPVSEP